MAEQQEDLAERLEREVQRRRRVVDIARRLASTLHHDELVRHILGDAAALLGAETASVLELDEGTGELVVAFVAGGLGEELTTTRIPAGQGIAGWVIANQQPTVVDSPEDDERFFADVDASSGFTTRNMLAVPLTTRDSPLGVLEVINKPDGFDAEDLELAQGLGSLAAIAIENARTYAGLADAIVTARMSYRM